MASGLPKQLMLIGGTTILGHTITRILQVPQVRHLVIPASADIRDKVRDIAAGCISAAGMAGEIRLDVVAGGKERMDSVGNGLKVLEKSGVELVMVHDAVRPCIPLKAVARALEVAATDGAALLAIPARDTVKMVDEAGVVTSTPERRRVWLAQTPQVFRTHVLAMAYETARESGFVATDDASVAEHAGFQVRVVDGCPDNIKITYPADLFFAEQWLGRHANESSDGTSKGRAADAPEGAATGGSAPGNSVQGETDAGTP
jgi:2-C-methyl-D-erythritol 4-phosphate cytidylyltransferase